MPCYTELIDIMRNVKIEVRGTLVYNSEVSA